MSTQPRAIARDHVDDVDRAIAEAMLRHPSGLTQREAAVDDYYPCCRGLGEHFDWCTIGAELAALERRLAMRNVIRTSRLDDLDAGDRAWDAR